MTKEELDRLLKSSSGAAKTDEPSFFGRGGANRNQNREDEDAEGGAAAANGKANGKADGKKRRKKRAAEEEEGSSGAAAPPAKAQAETAPDARDGDAASSTDAGGQGVNLPTRAWRKPPPCLGKCAAEEEAATASVREEALPTAMEVERPRRPWCAR